MNLSIRTRYSLCQFLGILDTEKVSVLFGKYSIDVYDCRQETLSETIRDLDSNSLSSLVTEVVETKKSLRTDISPKIIFDERFHDFEKCLLLDGYRIEEHQNTLVSVEPTIDGSQPLEDDLTTEITLSSLPDTASIIGLINDSANAFKQTHPKYNDCLTNARIALETLVDKITLKLTGNSETWGRNLNLLKSHGFLSQKEEGAIANTYTFISDGSHIPLGFTEEEFTRYGRNLTMSVCYYLIKKFNT